LEHNRIEELIPAYALGVLDEEDAHLVAAHLLECAACTRQVNAYEEAAASLLAAASPARNAPAGLHVRLMAQVTTTSPETPRELSWLGRLRHTLSGGRQWQFGAAIAVVLLVGLGVALLLFATQWRAGATVQLRGTELAPDAVGLLQVMSPKSGTLQVTGLPALDETKQYQLWLIKEDGTRDSGAVFSVEEDGSATIPVNLPQPLSRYSGMGITIEPEGGSLAPTGSKMLGS